MTRLIFAHEEIGLALGELTSRVMFGEGQLTRQERELVATTAAAAQRCTYCAETHGVFFSAEGGREETVSAVKEGRWQEATEGMTERERALCRIADKLSATPYRMQSQDWRELQALGIDDTGRLEVAHIVGMFNHLTRLASAFGLEVDEATARAT